jgi:hypothetical protein
VYLTASSKLNTTINQQQGLPNQSKCPKNAPRADCMGMGSQRAWLAGVPYAGHEGLSGREGERRLVATLVYTHCKVRHRAMDTKMTRKKKKKHTQTVINGQLICFLVINEQSLSYCTPHLDCNKWSIDFLERRIYAGLRRLYARNKIDTGCDKQAVGVALSLYTAPRLW